MGPFDRAAERPLTLGGVAGSAGQEVQARSQASQDRIKAQKLRSAGRQLDRQREPIEPDRDLCDGWRVSGGQSHPRANGRGSVDEERHGLVGSEALEVGAADRVGHGHLWDWELLLPGDMQGNPAGRQDRQPRGGIEEATDCACRFVDLLHVVQDEQQLAVAEMIGERVNQVPAGLLAHHQRPGNRRRHQARIRDRAQIGQVHAVGEAPELVRRDLQRQPRLADAARAREGEQARPLEQGRDLLHLMLAADERAPLWGQIAQAGIESADRGEGVGEAIDKQLVEVLGLFDVL
jgi:hypothetical protein